MARPDGADLSTDDGCEPATPGDSARVTRCLQPTPPAAAFLRFPCWPGALSPESIKAALGCDVTGRWVRARQQEILGAL